MKRKKALRLSDIFMAAHKDLIAQYLEEYPNADEDQAYDATTSAALYLMMDRIAAAPELMKDGEL